MRLVSIQNSQGQIRVAGVRDGQYIDLQSCDPEIPATMRELLRKGNNILAQVARAIENGKPISGNVTLLAPVPDPQKIFGIGLNYADHAREQGKEPPAEPVIFNKLPTCVRAHGNPIVLPKLSKEVDYEAELVVIIGKRGKHISRDTAMSYVAGYACGNDVSARDWQARKPGGQWLLGKSFDSFAPFGPELVTPDEVGDLPKLRIQSRIDGRVMQDSTLSQLIFDVPYLLEYISGICTLEPGDVIFTGTPPGVGMARKPPVWLEPGQTVEVEIERVGTLSNPVIAEEGRA
jgi:2-keto-4-pentenoate hydratase/2-oxohepta-3-ene-1,7-dioic acid hydratase in catechol pathway